MAARHLSRLQRRILAWLWQEEQRTRGTMSASYQDLVRALTHDKSNLSHSLRNLEARAWCGSRGRLAARPKRWT